MLTSGHTEAQQRVVTDIVRERETQKCKEQLPDLRKLHLEREVLWDTGRFTSIYIV